MFQRGGLDNAVRSKALKDMRVLQLISSGGLYGAERVLLNLVSHLKADGVQSTIAVFRNSQNDHTEVAEAAQEIGVRTVLVNCRGRVDRSSVRELRNVIEREKADVIHTHGYKSDIYGYVAAKGHSNAALVATCHQSKSESALSQRAYEALDLWTLKRYDRVVAVTSAVAEILERRGIDSQKIEVIENSADIGRFAEAKPTFWADFRERGYQAVGLVGRLILEKGGVEFLHAAKEVLSVLPRTIFVLVGDGPAHDVLAETSRNLRIEDAVIFAGRREDMPEVYASLDLVVLPSYAEGLPMTIIEALAARRPVVATAVGGVPRVIHDEITGLLLPDRNVGRLSEAIVRVLQDRVLGRRLAENGHQLVRERFSADSMARRYCELYSALPVGPLRRSA